MGKSAYESICQSLSGIWQGTNYLDKRIYLYNNFTSPDCKILFYDITERDPEICEFEINDLGFLDKISRQEAEKINPMLEETLKRIDISEFCRKNKVY